MPDALRHTPIICSSETTATGGRDCNVSDFELNDFSHLPRPKITFLNKKIVKKLLSENLDLKWTQQNIVTCVKKSSKSAMSSKIIGDRTDQTQK